MKLQHRFFKNPYNFNTKQDIADFFIVFLTCVYILFIIIGGYLNFSPVPFADTWDGYLNFITSLEHHDFYAWLTQHNEHRIILSKILFSIDFYLFHGSFIFLNIVNYLLATAIFVTFCFITARALPDKSDINLRFVAIISIAFFSFSWIQKWNFVDVFQSQFFLAQLLPLLSFYLLYLSTIKLQGNFYFILAVILGVASLGSMANGILVLPMLVFLGASLRISWKKLLFLTALSCIFIPLYFVGYKNVSHHGSLLLSIKEHPWDLLKFMLTYIGSPFYFASKKTFFISQIAGAFLILSSLHFAYKALFFINRYALQITLLFFIAYFGATALAISGSRLLFGLEEAVTSRYTTPALMAWSSLLILYLTFFKNKFLLYGKKIYFLLLIPALLFPYQFRALHEKDERYFNRKVGALALELKVNDLQQIKLVYPNPQSVQKSAEFHIQNDLFIFNDSQIENSAELIGQTYTLPAIGTCLGQIESMHKIETDPKFVRVSGWIYNVDFSNVPHKVIILNKDNKKIVGIAITGNPRPDIKDTLNKKEERAGFKGYMLVSDMNKKLLLIGREPDCLISQDIVKYIE